MQTIAHVAEVLAVLDQWVTEIPPVHQQGRFGNMAFRTWHERLTQVSWLIRLMQPH